MTQVRQPLGARPLDVTDEDEVVRRLGEPTRLASLARSRLLDGRHEEHFDRMVRVVANVLRVPVVLLSIVDDHRQFFKAGLGLDEPWSSLRETPLSHSYCKYIVANDLPLVVNDSSSHPLVSDNRATHELGVGAYLGVPIHDPSGIVLGALCSIEGGPRLWTSHELQLMKDFAAVVEGDITLRAEVERATVLDAWRRDTLAMLVHDLRPPLAAMATSADVLRSERPDTDVDVRKQLAALLGEGADSARELVDRLLLSESVLPAVLPLPFDLVEEVTRAAETVQAVAPDVRLHLPVGELPVTLDRTMVRQIVTNLMNNAVFHGGAAVSVSVDVQPAGEHAEIVVSDDGVGISGEEVHRIFEAFVRGPESTGHGLGLHIVDRLVEGMGGTVKVASVLGVGSRFVVTLPRTCVAGPIRGWPARSRA